MMIRLQPSMWDGNRTLPLLASFIPEGSHDLPFVNCSPFIPIWLVVGWFVHHKQYEVLECQVTDRSVNITKGLLFKTQKNIPLDKITDLAVKEGPILRALGLCVLNIETAGGGQGSAMGEASLIGVVDALDFRDTVLEQRDKVGGGSHLAESPPSDAAVLVEIRDALLRIEGRLNERE